MRPQPSASQIDVLVVDDSAAYVELLTALLRVDPRLEVVGQAHDGLEGVERALELRPDVVVMDVNMPRLDGIEATRRIRQQLPHTRVVIVTAAASPAYRARARLAGAAHFLHKDHIDELVGIVVGEAKAERSGARLMFNEAFAC